VTREAAARLTRRLIVAASVVALLATAGGVFLAVHGGAAAPPARRADPPSTANTAEPPTTTTPTTTTPTAGAPSSTTPATTTPTTAPPPAFQLGVYVGPGDAAQARAVDQGLGGKVTYVLDFLPKVTWASMTDIAWLTRDWAHQPFRLVLGVPMLPEAGGTLRAGAAGDYDAHFTTLADELVSAGLGDAVLMIGWQPDDRGSPWYVSNAAAARAYVRYWDRIRSAMASVPGAAFTFEWDAGDGGTSPVSPAAMYPGDAAVDVVATDAFDTMPPGSPRRSQWSDVLSENDGPAWMLQFARARHKPMAIAMFGEIPRSASGSGDDPTFLTGVLEWAAAGGVEDGVLWDYKSWAITGGGFPAADAALQKDVAAGVVAGG
jgi:hypothetical protein